VIVSKEFDFQFAGLAFSQGATAKSRAWLGNMFIKMRVKFKMQMILFRLSSKNCLPSKMVHSAACVPANLRLHRHRQRKSQRWGMEGTGLKHEVFK
jgi:hypothetical protein